VPKADFGNLKFDASNAFYIHPHMKPHTNSIQAILLGKTTAIFKEEAQSLKSTCSKNSRLKMERRYIRGRFSNKTSKFYKNYSGLTVTEAQKKKEEKKEISHIVEVMLQDTPNLFSSSGQDSIPI
jgi:hypothetical protein